MTNPKVELTIRIPEDEGAKQLALELEDEQPCDSGVCFT